MAHDCLLCWIEKSLLWRVRYWICHVIVHFLQFLLKGGHTEVKSKVTSKAKMVPWKDSSLLLASPTSIFFLVTIIKNTDYFGINVNAMLNVSSILFKQDRMPSWICRYFLFFNIQIHLGTETNWVKISWNIEIVDHRHFLDHWLPEATKTFNVGWQVLC